MELILILYITVLGLLITVLSSLLATAGQVWTTQIYLHAHDEVDLCKVLDICENVL